MRKFFYQLFVPHSRNNHRAKVLHHTSIIVLTFLVLAFSLFIIKVEHTHPNILGVSYSITAQELLDITNKDRAEKGLHPLVLSEKLSSAARWKADNMFQNNYWAHFAPDGTSPWDFIKNSGYDYAYAGENLAKGFTHSEAVVKAWMESESHRENMLSDKYKEVGFAIVEGHLLGEETVLIVEMFGAEAGSSAVATSQNAATTQHVAAASVPTKAAAEPVAPVSAPVITPIAKAEVEKKENVFRMPSITLPALKVESSPLIDVVSITRLVGIVVFFILIATFLVDLAVVEKRKIPRTVGHNFDHILILSLALIVFLLQKTGGII